MPRIQRASPSARNFIVLHHKCGTPEGEPIVEIEPQSGSLEVMTSTVDMTMD